MGGESACSVFFQRVEKTNENLCAKCIKIKVEMMSGGMQKTTTYVNPIFIGFEGSNRYFPVVKKTAKINKNRTDVSSRVLHASRHHFDLHFYIFGTRIFACL